MTTLRRVLTTLLWCVALVPPAAGAVEHRSCALPDDVRTRLGEIRASGCLPGEPCWGEQLAELRELHERHPASVPVHRAYQQLAEREDREALLAEYQAMVENAQGPGEKADALYLLARVDREQMEELVEQAVELDSSHPWASYALMVAGFSDGPDLDEELAKRLYETFRNGCPREHWAALAYAGRFGDPEWWTPHLDAIEIELAEEPTALRLYALPSLWQARFRLAPPGEHAAIRARIAEQLDAIEASEPSIPTLHWRVLEQGYELTGDTEGREKVKAELAALSPCSRDVAFERAESFWKARGGAAARAQMTREQARELYTAATTWIEECPDVFWYRSDRFAAVRNLPDLGDEQVLAEAEAMLSSWETAKKTVSMYQSPYFQVARLLLDRELAPERALELLDEEQALLAENHAAQPLPSDLPEEMRARIEWSRIQQSLEIELSRVEAHLALGDAKGASAPLERADELTANLEDSTDAQAQTIARTLRARWGVASARAALTSDRPALARSRLRRVETAALGDEALQASFEALAEELGLDLSASAGADDTAAIADASPWKTSDEALGDFEVIDLAGDTWRDENLEGKTTLVNFWATWCGPCVAELPLIEELHQELADRDDIDVITINLDRNVGLVQPFVTEHELSMPVLLGAEVADDWWNGAVSIPRTWVVDDSGVVRYRQMGFSAAEKDEWTAGAREIVERVASAADDRP